MPSSARVHPAINGHISRFKAALHASSVLASPAVFIVFGCSLSILLAYMVWNLVYVEKIRRAENKRIEYLTHTDILTDATNPYHPIADTQGPITVEQADALRHSSDRVTKGILGLNVAGLVIVCILLLLVAIRLIVHFVQSHHGKALVSHASSVAHKTKQYVVAKAPGLFGGVHSATVHSIDGRHGALSTDESAEMDHQSPRLQIEDRRFYDTQDIPDDRFGDPQDILPDADDAVGYRQSIPFPSARRGGGGVRGNLRDASSSEERCRYVVNQCRRKYPTSSLFD